MLLSSCNIIEFISHRKKADIYMFCKEGKLNIVSNQTIIILSNIIINNKFEIELCACLRPQLANLKVKSNSIYKVVCLVITLQYCVWKTNDCDLR